MADFVKTVFLFLISVHFTLVTTQDENIQSTTTAQKIPSVIAQYGNSHLARIFFSPQWRELYNYFERQCTTQTPNTVIKWTEDCVYICSPEGDPLFLDRRDNEFSVGIGTVALQNGAGETRPDGDDSLYVGDQCPSSFQKESVIEFTYDNDRGDHLVWICNENSTAEVLSIKHSRCPSGTSFPEEEEVPTNEIPGGDCMRQDLNTTVVDLAHNDFTFTFLFAGDDNLCTFRYCCDAVVRSLIGGCELKDFCARDVN